MVSNTFSFDEAGSVTAACEVIDGTNNEVTIKVGFSFTNPMDAREYLAIRARGLAKSRLKSSKIELPVPRDANNKLAITETVRNFLVESVKEENISKLEETLGLGTYNGKDPQFREWFPRFVESTL